MYVNHSMKLKMKILIHILNKIFVHMNHIVSKKEYEFIYLFIFDFIRIEKLSRYKIQ
jgi:hypothetical protein